MADERAFPVPADALGDSMSLRDWFAGQALRLDLLDQEFIDYMGYHKSRDIHDALAKRAYDIADAMLAARQKGQNDE